jgi:hypothetical protein
MSNNCVDLASLEGQLGKDGNRITGLMKVDKGGR